MAFEAFPWYKLTLVDQRKFVLAIQRMHNPTVLTCGTIKLDLELYVLVSMRE